MRTKTKSLLPPNKADILARHHCGHDSSVNEDCAPKWGAMLNTEDFRVLSVAVVLKLTLLGSACCPIPSLQRECAWEMGTSDRKSRHYNWYITDLAKIMRG